MSNDPYSISNDAKPIQPPYSPPTTGQKQFDDPYSMSNDPYSMSNDPYSMSNDPYSISNDPYGISTDSYHVTNDTYNVSDDPYSISNDPYKAMTTEAGMGLPMGSEKNNSPAPPYQEFADGQGRPDKANGYSEKSKETFVSAPTGDVRAAAGQTQPENVLTATSTSPVDNPEALQKRTARNLWNMSRGAGKFEAHTPSRSGTPSLDSPTKAESSEAPAKPLEHSLTSDASGGLNSSSAGSDDSASTIATGVTTAQDGASPSSTGPPQTNATPVVREKRRRPFSSLNSFVNFSSSSRAGTQTEPSQETPTITESKTMPTQASASVEGSASPATSSKSAPTADYFAEARPAGLASRTLSDNISTQKTPINPFKPSEAALRALEFDINEPDEEGYPLLVRAAMDGSEEMVQKLIKRHADVEATDASKRTALHASAAAGNSAVCILLLDNGAQLESTEVNSKTALQLAVEAGHVDTVELLLNRSTFKPGDAKFLAAWSSAVEAGNVRVAEKFFEKGATPKALKKAASMPVIWAAKNGNLEMLDFLIGKKFGVEGEDGNGWTALHLAAQNGYEKIIERLLEKKVSAKAVTPQKETPLHLSVKAGHVAATEALLGKKGTAIGSQDIHDQEPLHLAARGGSAVITNALLLKKADVNAEDKFGWQPLHIAIAYGYTELVEQLMKSGAKIEEKLGSTSYKKAQTQTFLESGYWAEARWPHPGSRPLHLSTEYEREDITRILIEKGAKVDSECSKDWRPLHHAAFNGSVSSVELLLNSGAYVHAVNSDGATPLAVGFRTSGRPISDADKARVQELLQSAMDTMPRHKADKLKNLGKSVKSKTADEKNEALKVVEAYQTASSPS